MAERKPHIGIELPDNAPDIFIDKILADLYVDGLELKVRKRPEIGPMNALEWIIPTAIAAYIFKSYFDGFLKEAGKDHYLTLGIWLKKFINNGREIKVKTIYSSQSLEKQPNKNTQSKSVSLHLQTKNGKIIKLLFDNDLQKDDWDNAINQLLDFAIDNNENYPNDNLTKQLEKFGTDSRIHVYAIIDKVNKGLLFYSDKDFIFLHRRNNEE